MTYAYCQTTDLLGRDTVVLFVSEERRPVPAGFRICTYARFVEAWRERDALRAQALRERALRGQHTKRVTNG